jgi:hypothetical protein
MLVSNEAVMLAMYKALYIKRVFFLYWNPG